MTASTPPGIPAHWIPHRREDGELVGWIDMDSATPDLLPIDRLGRPMTAVADWDEAEESLDAVGLRFLTGRWTWREDGRELRVRITHVYDDRVVLSTALTDAVEEVGRRIVVPFPAPPGLRPLPD